MIKKIADALFFLLLLSIPTQLGKHFWPPWSLVLGRRIDYLSPTFYLTDAIFILWVIIVIFLYHKKFLPAFKKNLVWIIGGLFLFFYFWLSSANKIISFYYLIRITEIVVFGFMVYLVKPNKNTLIKAFGLSTVFIVFLAVWQFFQQNSVSYFYFLGERDINLNTPSVAHLVVWGKLFLRPYSIFSHPNVLAGFLLVQLPLIYFWKINLKSKWQYLLKHSVLILIFLGIFISFSRTAWVGILIFLIYLTVQLKVNKYQAVFFALLLIMFLMLEEINFGRITHLWLDQQSLVERNFLTGNAFDIFFKSPLWGWGLGSFITNLPKIQTPPFLLQPVHNFWLLVLSETGIIGFIICLSMFIKSWCLAKKTKKYDLLSCLILILFLSFFDHYFYDIKQAQWLLGIITVMVYL